MKLKTIYEDENVIVIDKPAGIAVHPRDKNDNKPTIVGIVSQTNPEIKTVGENPLRPGIVHRLDKETSGLMVVAKNNESFYELKKQFQERKVEKRYIALVSGVLTHDEGTIKMPLVKMGTRTTTRASHDHILTIVSKRLRGTPNVRGVSPHRAAVSEYKVLKRYNDYTLVEVRPKTGRQHQIRVHFASINHPIACDKLYGRKAKKCPAGLKRHFLHSAYLKFQLKNALMEFENELPQDISAALKMLK